jgi:excisionase family DNA binding protein
MKRPDLNPVETPLVSTKQVAKALGVSVTTVKRWVDDGILPAHRTPGGHRKLIMADVLRVARTGNLPQADMGQLLPPVISAAGDPDVFLQQLLNAFQMQEWEQIRYVILNAYHAGMAIESISDFVIAPAMMHVAHEWIRGVTTVSHEHLITQMLVGTLYELGGLLRNPITDDRPIAIGGAPEHDHFVMPSLLAKLTLADAGWNAINLGPHTPFFALIESIEKWSPTMIWLSVSHITDGNRFAKEYREMYAIAEKRGIAVAIGGRALTEAVRMRLPYTSHGDGFTQFAAFARTLHQRPAPPKRGRPKKESTEEVID